MSSAIRMGEGRLRALIERHGIEDVRTCLGELIERSERQMRSHIEEIPDGTYTYTDYLDNDGLVDDADRGARSRSRSPAATCRSTSRARRPAVRGPVNLARNSTVSACYVALKHIFPDVPINGGTFRPAKVHVPPGTLLSAEYPLADERLPGGRSAASST